MERPLLVDRFEVSRGLWRAAAAGEPLLEGVTLRWPELPGGESLPATHCTVDEAEALAGRRGLRLPTVEEWMFLATGPSSNPWPWGIQFRSSSANTVELGLERPLPVGTFETGTSPARVYDLVGNVWEWTRGDLPQRTQFVSALAAYPGRFGPGPPVGPVEGAVEGPVDGAGGEEPLLEPGQRNPVPAPRSPFEQVPVIQRVRPVDWSITRLSFSTGQTVMGGSYLWRRQPLWQVRSSAHVFNARAVARSYFAADLGLRCVADAREYLRRGAQGWSHPSLRPRLIEVGRRWGERALAVLEELAGEEGAPPALSWLLEGARR